MTDENETQNPEFSAKHGNRISQPIWYSPIWITAIVSLVSVFLTVPEVVESWIKGRHDIRLAVEKTTKAQIENDVARQDYEYQTVKNVLVEVGDERVLLLRYLAATLNDADAKEWAEREVKTLGTYNSEQEKLILAQQDFAKKEIELQKKLEAGDATATELKTDVEELARRLNAKISEVATLRQNAGLSGAPNSMNLVLYQVKMHPDFKGVPKDFVIKAQDTQHNCVFNDNECTLITMGSTPALIDYSFDGVVGDLILASIKVVTVQPRANSLYPAISYPSYACMPMETGMETLVKGALRCRMNYSR